MLAVTSSAGSFPILTLIVVLPAITAVLIALLDSRRAELAKLTALLSSGTRAAMTV